MDNTNIFQPSFDEIDAFLEGELSESREKEVADAINNSKELQEYIDSCLDIDDIILFDEIKSAERGLSNDSSNSVPSFTIVGSTGESKWSKYLTRKGDSQKGTSSWKQEEYKKAADSTETENTHTSKQNDSSKGNKSRTGLWGSIILVAISLSITVIKTCSENRENEIQTERLQHMFDTYKNHTIPNGYSIKIPNQYYTTEDGQE